MSRGQFVTLCIILSLAVVAGAIAGSMIRPVETASAQELNLPPSPSPSGGSAVVAPSFADLAEKAIPSVVLVVNERDATTDPHEGIPNFRRFFGNPFDEDDEDETPRQQRLPQSTGAGFFITADGYLLTNKHVVEEADHLWVRFNDGERADATLIGVDPSLDLALLKVEPVRSFPALPLGDSENLRVGEWVIAIGNPVGFTSSVTVGVVSGKGRRLGVDSMDLSNYIQTDAAINFGNSGGPLLNARGEVVGINTAIIRGNRSMMNPMQNSSVEGLGFALPVTMVKSVLDQLVKTGTVRRGYLGVSVSDLTDEAAEWAEMDERYGALVQTVTEGMPAESAGIRQGDIIQSVNGRRIEGREELVESISTLMPDEEVRIGVWREGKPVEVEVTLAVRPGSEDGAVPTPVVPEEEGEVEDLGFTVRPLPPSMRRTFDERGVAGGLLVFDVDPDSNAYEKGLRPGSVLVDINGEAVSSLADFREAVSGIEAGQVVRIRIMDSRFNEALIFFRVTKNGR